ncbi:MAG TPA: S1/P1 nuclease [Candidatus Sphingobacterium stercorigallinarum]|nr:S1/P1 nuclease [Candidatus Sphingobacterium stercorigallinarum]
MQNLFRIIILFVFLGFSQQVFGWGMTGHRVIAEIAENHLNRKAKRNIERLIGKQKLAYWSNWADFIKSSSDTALLKTSSWHFVNAPGHLSFEAYQEVLRSSPEHNLYKAYQRVREQASDRRLDDAKRREALYFMIHLLADAHQPMHVGREEDLGGNRISVSFFNRKTNIHRVWDSDLVDNEKYGYTEYARVLDYNPAFYAQYTNSSLEEWFYESHQLANLIYQDVAKEKKLAYDYVFRFKEPMEQCLLKAGLRLAKELNAVFG